MHAPEGSSQPPQPGPAPRVTLQTQRSRNLLAGCTTKRQFSELTGEAVCNQEYASGLEQRLDDEAEPVVAQSQAPVFQDPGIAAFDRPAPLAQSRPARLTALVDARLGTKGAAQLAMMLRVVAFVGEYRANAGHDRE